MYLPNPKPTGKMQKCAAMLHTLPPSEPMGLGNAEVCRENIKQNRQKLPRHAPHPKNAFAGGQGAAWTTTTEAPLAGATHSYWSRMITVRRTIAFAMRPSQARFSAAESH